jgi:hypothetical protein
VLDLLVDAATLLLGVLERGLEQAGVLLLLGGGEDEGGVGRGVLGLVLSDRLEVSLQNRVVFLVSALVKERRGEREKARRAKVVLERRTYRVGDDDGTRSLELLKRVGHFARSEADQERLQARRARHRRTSKGRKGRRKSERKRLTGEIRTTSAGEKRGAWQEPLAPSCPNLSPKPQVEKSLRA